MHAARWRLAAAVSTAVAAATATVALAAGAAPATVKGGPVPRTPDTAKPGTAVPEKDLGERVFVSSRYGYALAAVGQAQFAAATSDGGKTWHIASPALHVDAAQAPLSVIHIGAADAHTAYAYGSAQAVDVTDTGGSVWYRTLFPGLVESVETNFQRHIVVYEQAGEGTPVEQYVSKNGGRTWTLTKALFGG